MRNRSRSVRTPFLFAFGALALVACSSPPASGNANSDTPPSEPSSPASDDPATPPTASDDAPAANAPSNDAPARPAPQSTVRDCGHAFTKPEPLDAYRQWVKFGSPHLGAWVLGTNADASFGTILATGAPSRIASAASGSSTGGADKDGESVRHALGLHTPGELGNDVFANNSSAMRNDEIVKLFYTEPSTTILTFTSAWGEWEPSWHINEPKRGPAANNHPASDLFARGLMASRFFAWEALLLFPDACSVGALSDALGRPAFLKDATPDSGIFKPATMAAAQEALVKNGVKLMVRVTSNKQSASVDTLLDSTACTPGNLAECKKLFAALDDASTAFKITAAPSTVEGLQAGTDPFWDTIEVSASPLSILP